MSKGEAPVREASRARTLGGMCLCGAVHYAVADEFRYALNCHCSRCRRATGSAFKPFAGIERAKLNISRGRDQLVVFGDECAHDARCSVCGSRLYSVVRDGAFVHVTLGTLVDDRRRTGSRLRMTCLSTGTLDESRRCVASPVALPKGRSMPH